jgi:hypothetical protein
LIPFFVKKWWLRVESSYFHSWNRTPLCLLDFIWKDSNQIHLGKSKPLLFLSPLLPPVVIFI